MNERLAAGLLAGLSAALIVAETATGALRGFDAGIILFWLALYAGAAGLLFSLRMLSDGGSGRIESVSERRARAKRGDGGILEGYDVDEEFLGSGQRARKPASAGAGTVDDESLKAAILSYAGMAGGLGKLSETLEAMDEASFGAMARKIGASGVSKGQALAAVAELAAAESGGKGGEDVPPLQISLDRETFDDYIRRCMTDRDTCIDDDESAGESFSIGLDADGLSRLPGAPPTEFSHSPEAVKAKINRPAGGPRP
ncbi:MAG: hypothetical protein HGB04_08590 [Chlorobiaceae bacterium]|nr:hypothetical protein [Chlorobiaceae bacterium]